MSDKPASPYKTLGVKKTSNKEEIRAAFKTLAKKHHPDVAGGENDTFNRIKAAYDLLMDDKARKLYDDYGLIPGDDSSLLRMQAMQGLSGMFGQLLAEIGSNGQALEETDVFGLLGNHISKEIVSCEDEIAKLKEEEKRLVAALQIVKKRMKCKGAHNIFTDSLEANIAHIPGIIAMKEREKLLLREMQAVLKDYSFEFTRKARGSTYVMTMPMHFTTTSTASGW
jgi:curved DNA-binding protein CbpA